MRYLLIGDVHLSDRAPSSTTDTYTDDLFDLLAQTVKLADDYDGVCWAGDIFHYKQPTRNSHKLVQRAIDVVQAYTVPLYIVAGNHDITNDRLQSLEQQPLGVLYKSGAINLEGWNEDQTLYGVPWQQRWLDPDTPREAFADWREVRDKRPTVAQRALVVTHAPIYPPGLEFELEYVPTLGENGISAAMGNIGSVYYGHIHEKHGVFTADGVQYCNNGALSRGSLTEYNLDREVVATCFDSETRKFTEVPLKHKPAEEVFRIATVTATKQEKIEAATFLEGIASTKLDITSVESVIDHIGTMTQVPANVRKVAQDLLREV